jgi:hypothetical protein
MRADFYVRISQISLFTLIYLIQTPYCSLFNPTGYISLHFQIHIKRFVRTVQSVATVPRYDDANRVPSLLKFNTRRSQWPWRLRRGSAAAHLFGLWFRIPPEVWMSVSCKRRVLSGRGLCAGLIARPEESYRMCCVCVWSWALDN